VQSIAMIVTMSLCPSVCSHLRNNVSRLHEIFEHVTCGCASLLLWRQCNTSTSCTSGYVDGHVCP